MNVTLEFFGVLERLAGRPSLALDLAQPAATVGEVLEELARRVPDLTAELGRAACAIGDELVARDQWVAPGARIALLPPVAGG